MIPLNIRRILDLLDSADLVVDIGGWACPFNRANYVIDSEPYETRGFYRTFGGPPFQGGDREWFTKETWIQRDICDRHPLPFEDKAVDFVICSHTLEDIRDPLWVCAEMIRIGKRGYIEVPSRLYESTRAIERPGQAGLSHHRWLVEIEDNRVIFIFKYHMIHSHWRFSLPKKLLTRLPQEYRVQWLFWEGSFEFYEKIIHGIENQEAELEGFVQKTCPYPQWRLHLDRALRQAVRLPQRAIFRVGRSVCKPCPLVARH